MKYVGLFFAKLGLVNVVMMFFLSSLWSSTSTVVGTTSDGGNKYTVKNTQDAPEEIRTKD